MTPTAPHRSAIKLKDLLCRRVTETLLFHIIQENLEYAGSVFNGNQQYLVITATLIGQVLAP